MGRRTFGLGASVLAWSVFAVGCGGGSDTAASTLALVPANTLTSVPLSATGTPIAAIIVSPVSRPIAAPTHTPTQSIASGSSRAATPTLGVERVVAEVTTPTPTRAASVMPSRTRTGSLAPTPSPVQTPVPFPTPTATGMVSATPTPAPTVAASAMPSPTRTGSSDPTPSPVPAPVPSPTPTATAIASATPTPTAPAPQEIISAKIVGFGPSSRVEVDVGLRVVLRLTVLNTGNVAHRFTTSVIVSQEAGPTVETLQAALAEPLIPGEQRSVEWTYTVGEPGDLLVQYLLRGGDSAEGGTLLDKAPSPPQNLIFGRPLPTPTATVAPVATPPATPTPAAAGGHVAAPPPKP